MIAFFDVQPSPLPSDQGQTDEGQELPVGSPAPSGGAIDLVLPDTPIPVVLAEDVPLDSQPFSITGSPYDGGLSISSLNYFSGVMRKYAGTDYVAFRSDQYEYTLCYGDISLSGTSFSSASCTVVTYSTRYNTTVSSFLDSLSLNASSQPVYSSLGSYPELEGVNSLVWQKVSCIAFAVIVLFFVLFTVLRRR